MNREPFQESIYILRKRYLNVLQMLEDRGYHILTAIYDEIDDKVFERMCVNENGAIDLSRLDLLVINNKGENILIFFSNEKSTGIASLHGYIQRMNNHGSKHGILIYKESISNTLNNAIEHFASQIRFELFDEEYFNLCVVNHELVPEHKVLSPAEKVEFLKKYTQPIKNLPRILSYDPVARYYGLERGQIVRVRRSSLLGGEALYYRICY